MCTSILNAERTQRLFFVYPWRKQNNCEWKKTYKSYFELFTNHTYVQLIITNEKIWQNKRNVTLLSKDHNFILFLVFDNFAIIVTPFMWTESFPCLSLNCLQGRETVFIVFRDLKRFFFHLAWCWLKWVGQ